MECEWWEEWGAYKIMVATVAEATTGGTPISSSNGPLTLPHHHTPQASTEQRSGEGLAPSGHLIDEVSLREVGLE